jgi:hypothetical protein
MGSGNIAPPILTSALDGGEWSASRSGSFTPEENIPDTLLDRRMGVPQDWSECCGEERILPLPGIIPRPSSPKSVVVPTELSHSTFVDCNKHNVIYTAERWEMDWTTWEGNLVITTVFQLQRLCIVERNMRTVTNSQLEGTRRKI